MFSPFKVMLMLMVLLVAYGFAVILLRRLTDITHQVSDLKDQIKRNDARLHTQVNALKERKSQDGS